MTLLEHQTDQFSIDELWQAQLSYQQSVDDLAEEKGVPDLEPDWRRPLSERAKWHCGRFADGF